MADDHVALLVNNLGSTSELEMNIVALEAIKLLGNIYFCFFALHYYLQALYLNILYEMYFHVMEFCFSACNLQ